MSGSAERIGLFLAQARSLDMAHGVVAEVAGEAAGEAQRRGHRRDAVRAS